MLPGISDLEAEYGAALNTVRAAEGILRNEGLLLITQGVGAEVIALPTGNERRCWS
jgi:DNA-binding GntR family transcriptional regulator